MTQLNHEIKNCEGHEISDDRILRLDLLLSFCCSPLARLYAVVFFFFFSSLPPSFLIITHFIVLFFVFLVIFLLFFLLLFSLNISTVSSPFSMHFSPFVNSAGNVGFSNKISLGLISSPAIQTPSIF